MGAPYILHGTWLSGPTYKVALMLTLLGRRFDYVHVDLRSVANKRPEFLEKNRFGQVPCLIDVTKGLSLCQSGSILMHLAEDDAQWRGETPEQRLRVCEWILWAFDRLVPNMYRPRADKLGFRKLHEATLQLYRDDGEAALKVLDDWLQTRDWLVGNNATVADVDVYGAVSYAEEAGYDLSRYPALTGWVSRIQQLPRFLPAKDLLPQKSTPAS